MKTAFLFQGMEVDEKAKAYIVKRLLVLEKLLHHSARVEVEGSKDKKGLFRIEITASEPKNRLYRSEETSESIEGSTDIAIDEVKRQIREEKEREESLTRRGERSIKKRLTLDKNARF